MKKKKIAVQYDGSFVLIASRTEFRKSVERFFLFDRNRVVVGCHVTAVSSGILAEGMQIFCARSRAIKKIFGYHRSLRCSFGELGARHDSFLFSPKRILATSDTTSGFQGNRETIVRDSTV